MADIVDLANDVVEQTTALKIKEASGSGLEVEATGECLLCGEPLPDGRRWCDAEHRDRWELERKRR